MYTHPEPGPPVRLSGREEAVSTQMPQQQFEQKMVTVHTRFVAAQSQAAISLRHNEWICEDLLHGQDEMHDTYYHLQQKLDNNYDTLCAKQKRMIDQRVELGRDVQRHKVNLAMLTDNHAAVVAKLKDEVTETRESLTKAQRDFNLPDVALQETTMSTVNEESSGKLMTLAIQGFPDGDILQCAKAAKMVNTAEVQCTTAAYSLKISRHYWIYERIRRNEHLLVELQQMTEDKVAAMTVKVFGRLQLRRRAHNPSTSKYEVDEDGEDLTHHDYGTVGTLGEQHQRTQDAEVKVLTIEDRVFKAHVEVSHKLCTLEKRSTTLATEHSRLETTVRRLWRELALAQGTYHAVRTLKFLDTERSWGLSNTECDKTAVRSSSHSLPKARCETTALSLTSGTKRNDDKIQHRTYNITVHPQVTGRDARKIPSARMAQLEMYSKQDPWIHHANECGCRAFFAANGVVKLLFVAISEARTDATKTNAVHSGLHAGSSLVKSVFVGVRHTHPPARYGEKRIAQWSQWSHHAAAFESNARRHLLRHLAKCAHSYRASILQLVGAADRMRSPQRCEAECETSNREAIPNSTTTQQFVQARCLQ